MKVIGIILAVLSFIGGQAYLVYLLGKLDKHLESRSEAESDIADDDGCRNPDENVVE